MQCLNRERLLAFLAGLATDEEAAHVEGCPPCQRALEEVPDPDDPFQNAVRASAAEPPLPDGFADIDTVIVPNASAAPAFDRVGEYDLLHLIGHGGMGEVFEGRQRSTGGRAVAVKLIYLVRFTDDWHEPLRRRFRRELRIAAPLEHRNIVRVYDGGEDGGRPFLVMERLHGETLYDIARRRPLAVADACEVVRQMAEGLAHAHDRAVIHRDVKPNNTLLTRDGVVKMLDWGLAKEGDSDDLTKPGEVWGARGYVSPEQRDDFATVDLRTDIYGLGATLFFALTGQAPGGTTELPSDLPPALADLVRRTLADDPNGRPRSAGEVAQALADFARGADLKALAGNADALLAALAVRWWDGAANRYRSLGKCQ